MREEIYQPLSSEDLREIIGKAKSDYLTSPEYLARQVQRKEMQKRLEPYRDRSLNRLIVTD